VNKIIAICGIFAMLSGCSMLDRVNDKRESLRQQKSELDAVIQEERKAQVDDAFDELCKEAPIGELIQRFGTDMSQLRSLCNWE
jgi:hypothetical protein|tara:strand:- start:251 stop:502 length:252 start_codon:yes stop_codon:yes gene_type:complete